MTTNVAATAMSFQEKTEAIQAYVMHHASDSSVMNWPFDQVRLPRFLSFGGVMVILATLVIIAVFRFLYRKDAAVPTGMTNLLELFIVFIRDKIAIPFLGNDDGRRMTPLFCSFFFFILTLNLMGLVPCFYSATGNPNVTFALAVISLSFMIFGAIYRNGLAGFVKGFIPHGVPWPVVILLVPIEFMGLFIRAFALMVRLFANMLAGHMVVLFLLGMLILLGIWGLPFFLVGVLIYGMEVGVAFLQAYIFTFLSAIFIGQRYHPSH